MPIFRYLIERSERLIIFTPNMFMSSSERMVEITIECHERGVLRWRREWVFRSRLPLPVKYAIAYACYAMVAIFMAHRGGWAITTQPIFGFGCRVYRALKGTRTAFWVWDHFGDMYPHYAKLDDHAVRHADHVLFASRTMEAVYARRAPAARVGQPREQLSHGLIVESLDRNPKDGRLGYIGIVRKEDGLINALDAIADDPTLSLDVVGDGDFLSTIKERVSQLGIDNRVRFLGRIDDKEALDVATADWQIGLAVYARTPFTPYIDPGKIKTYWQRGFPVITTAVVPTADEIALARAGEVVATGTAEEIGAAIRRIRADAGAYEAGVQVMRERYEYRSLFDKGLAFMRS